MTYVPAPLAELQDYMQEKTGLPPNSLGVYPDDDHDGGYHCGWDRRRIRNGVLDDYSWQESPRDWNHKTDAARAFDCGSFSRLQEMSVWIVQECQRGAPDTLDIREVIYSPDGAVVKRWDRLGIRSGGDDSHLFHTHFSFFADAEAHDKLSVFQRFFGDNMTEGDRNVGYMTQNALVGVQEPEFDIPAEDGYPAYRWGNPFGAVLHALMSGTDASLPEFAGRPARIWPNGTTKRLAAIEAKLDQLLAMPPGSANPEAIRAIVRDELDKTKLGLGAL